MTENEIILNALIEYEENHFETEDEEWQKKVNNLLDDYQARVDDAKYRKKISW